MHSDDVKPFVALIEDIWEDTQVAELEDK